MSGPTLVFDLETQRLAHEVGGWGHVERLGLAAAVLLEVETSVAAHYTEAEAPALIERLASAGRVIGYNLLRFDYAVLRPYGLAPGLEGRTTDMLAELHRALGFYLPLDNLAAATLGETKTADGLAAVRWYRQGQIEKVLAYCEQDVRLTWRLWEHGRVRRQVQYRDRDHRLRSVPVRW